MFSELTVPTRGKINPAPTLALTSLIGTVKLVGLPFLLGSCDRDRCVLAIHIGSPLNPYKYMYMLWYIYEQDMDGNRCGTKKMKGNRDIADQILLTMADNHLYAPSSCLQYWLISELIYQYLTSLEASDSATPRERSVPNATLARELNFKF